MGGPREAVFLLDDIVGRAVLGTVLVQVLDSKFI